MTQLMAGLPRFQSSPNSYYKKREPQMVGSANPTTKRLQLSTISLVLVRVGGLCITSGGLNRWLT
jgi:hypothetical protein